MNVIKAFCCLAVLALSVTAEPQPDGGIDDFLAVSNSVHKAMMNNWMGLPGVYYERRPKEIFEQLRFIFDMMKPLATSQVEVICYRGLGFGPGSLVYWMTDEAVYMMEFSREIFMERKREHFITTEDGKEHRVHLNYNLSISKKVRTKTFDAELDAFESVPLKEASMNAVDAPLGFYVRRTPDGTFESIYFPIVAWMHLPIPDNADEQLAEGIKMLNDKFKTDKMSAFAHLLEKLGELMGKTAARPTVTIREHI